MAGDKLQVISDDTPTCLTYLSRVDAVLTPACKALAKVAQNYLALTSVKCFFSTSFVDLGGFTLPACIIAASGTFCARFYNDQLEKKPFIQALSAVSQRDHGDEESSCADQTKPLLPPAPKKSSSCCGTTGRKFTAMVEDIKQAGPVGGFMLAVATISCVPGIGGDFSATFAGMMQLQQPDFADSSLVASCSLNQTAVNQTVVNQSNGMSAVPLPGWGAYIFALFIAMMANRSYLTFRFTAIPRGLATLYNEIKKAWHSESYVVNWLPLIPMLGTVAAYFYLNQLFASGSPGETAALAVALFSGLAGPVTNLCRNTVKAIDAFFHSAAYPLMFLSLANGVSVFDYTRKMIKRVLQEVVRTPFNGMMGLGLLMDAAIFFVVMWNTTSCALGGEFLQLLLALFFTLSATACYGVYNLKAVFDPKVLALIDEYNDKNQDSQYKIVGLSLGHKGTMVQLQNTEIAEMPRRPSVCSRISNFFCPKTTRVPVDQFISMRAPPVLGG